MESSITRAARQLGQVPLFAGLPEAALEELVTVGRLRRFPAGQILWSEGDAGDALLVLEEGQLRISRLGANGQEAVLAVVEPPAAVGELSLLDGAPRDATVVAQRPVAVRLITRQAFLTLLREQPAVTEGLLVTLAAMVRAANARHSRIIGLDVPGRLAAWLLERAARGGRSGTGGGVVIPLDRTQGELAAELGTTRSTLNRALSAFEDLDLISVEGEQIVIADISLLGPYTQ